MLQALLSGIIPGSVYALLGVSLVLVYRMTGVLNFAQTAIGAAGAYTFMAAAQAGFTVGPAAVFGILTSVCLSLFLGWLMSAFFAEDSPEIRATVTIAYCLALLILGFRVFGDKPRPMPNVLPDWSVDVGPLVLSSATAIALGAALFVAAGLTWALSHSRLGLLVRAMSSRPTTAKIVGIKVAKLSLLIWALAGAIAVVAITLAAPNRASSFLSLTLLLIPSLAAALFGLYRSFTLALAGGLALGLLEGLATQSDWLGPLRSCIPFVAIALVLGWTQRKERWDGAR